MDSAKAQLADKLKGANNILVTVSRDPSVDQLAACIGLTLLLNKLGKHAAAVFSGQTPSTIEFLKPEETIEKNTDSLRDFIIALDKSKADKLRYKVEDNVVRIFITPYKTSISEADLDFSQGDFNVDVVVALGVARQEDLDEAITAHGRILHDATVASVNTSPEDGGLGSINWHDPQASSLSELVTELAQTMGGELLDNQIATALLTGIVAETARFSNEKTSAQTMSASAALMAAGANQQLVATKLEEPQISNPSDDKPDDSANPATLPGDEPKPSDGTLDINHDANDLPAPTDSPDTGDQIGTTSDEAPELQQIAPLPALELPEPDSAEPAEAPAGDHVSSGSRLMTEAPTLGGMLTANSQPEGLDPTTDPLSSVMPEGSTLLDHDNGGDLPKLDDLAVAPSLPAEPTPPLSSLTDLTPSSDLLNSEPTPPPTAPAPAPVEPYKSQAFISGLTPPPPAWVPPSDDPFNLNQPATDEPKQTLTDLELSVHSPHTDDASHLDAARDEVSRALNATPDTPGPIEALNAQPLGDVLHSPDSIPMDPILADDQPGPGSMPPLLPSLDTSTLPVLNDSPTSEPQTIVPGSAPMTTDPNLPSVTDPAAPPPVPPPIPFQFNPPSPS